jgi:uncharacterized protein (DUF1499 family)
MAHRRYIPSEPTSRLAIWSLRLAGFAFVVAFLAAIIMRWGVLETKPAFATFAGAMAVAVVALVVALAAFAVIWSEGLAGMRAALAAMAISLALLAYPAYLATKAYRLPWIYDITTDPIDPPLYDALAPLRTRENNPVAYAGLYAAEQQRQAYPDIGPLGTHATPQNAYRASLAVMSKHKDSIVAPYWRVMTSREPAGRRDGRIEAIAYSSFLGFRDDVILRVRPEPDGARIDVRSSSRYGTFDFGTNAARIRRLLNDIEESIRAQRSERPPPTPAPAKKKTPLVKRDKQKKTKEPFFR